MVRNLLAQRPEKVKGRSKVLLLGISYPSVEGHMKQYGFDPSILDHHEPSVDQAVECVRRGIMTEMDGRDLARCVSTEQVCDMDVYTVSKEVGGVYRSDRHIYADFNARNFCSEMKEAFGPDIQFNQIILDYYWMPTGWLVTRWARTLFQKTLPDLVKYNLLAFPSKRTKRRSSNDLEVGVVYLPFCSHCCKEIVAGIHVLEKYYSITFVKKGELSKHALWKGTMNIDAHTMQTRLGKRLDQEEVYCTFRPKDVMETMEDCHVTKPQIMRILTAIEDYDDVRMIRLRPLRQHEPPSVLRERLIAPEKGGFLGLNFSRRRNKQGSPGRGKSSPNKTSPTNKSTTTVRRGRPPLSKSRILFDEEPDLEGKSKSCAGKRSKPTPIKGPPTNGRSKRYSSPIRKAHKSSMVEAVTNISNLQRRRPGQEDSWSLRQRRLKRRTILKEQVYDNVEVASTPRRRLDLMSGYGPKLLSSNDIPAMTYFYPAPAVDLTTFDDPIACAKEDKKAPQGIQRMTARSMLARKNSLENLEPPIVATVPKQYLSSNPRCGNGRDIRQLQQPQQQQEEDAVQSFVPKDAGRNFELEAACILFEMKNCKLKSVSRHGIQRSEIACYLVPRAAIVERLQKHCVGENADVADYSGGVEDDAKVENDKPEKTLKTQQATASTMANMPARRKPTRFRRGNAVNDEQITVEQKTLPKEGAKTSNVPTPDIDRERQDVDWIQQQRKHLLIDITNWLEKPNNSNDPNGEFSKVDAMLSKPTNDCIKRRATRIEERLSFLRCLDPSWFRIDSIQQKDQADKLERKRMVESLTEKIGYRFQNEADETEGTNETCLPPKFTTATTTAVDENSSKRRRIEVTPDRFVEENPSSGFSSVTEENPVCISPTPPSSECEG